MNKKIKVCLEEGFPFLLKFGDADSILSSLQIYGISEKDSIENFFYPEKLFSISFAYNGYVEANETIQKIEEIKEKIDFGGWSLQEDESNSFSIKLDDPLSFSQAEEMNEKLQNEVLSSWIKLHREEEDIVAYKKVTMFFFSKEQSSEKFSIENMFEIVDFFSSISNVFIPNSNLRYDVLLEFAKKYSDEYLNEFSNQKRCAFANSVSYFVTGWSGGYGGPSVREHAASRFKTKSECSLSEVIKMLEDPKGPIFGPITDLHRNLYQIEHCFDDDPDDIIELEKQ